MADEVQKQDQSKEEIGDQKNIPSQPPVDLAKYVPIEQHRTYQSKMDRKVAELERERDEAIRARQLDQEEVAKILETQPELKSKVELVQDKAIVARYKQEQQEKAMLADAKRQWAAAFSISENDLSSATTSVEVFQLAMKLRDEKLLDTFRTQYGVPKPSKTKEEEQEPPIVPVSQGPAPDSTLRSDAEVEKRIRDIEAALKDPNTPRREKSKLRTEWLKVQGMRGSRRSSRARV